jgi:hypothetical protein
MTIFQYEGVAVGVFFGSQLFNIEKGNIDNYRICLSDMCLAPGKYYCGISVGTGSHLGRLRDYDVILEVLGFEIIQSGVEEGVSPLWNPKWGSIIFKQPQIKIIS